MSTLDRETLAEKAATVERHLRRVAAQLPANASDLRPMTEASDAVILHLWQAVQLVVDVATAMCVRLRLTAPASYAEAFRSLAGAGVIDAELAERLARAAGFRNLVAHAYEKLDMARVHRSASLGPPDLRAFLVAVRDHVPVCEAG
jgi:uncharacterized protein YutE (UPF0331/DUF86 family)